MSSFSSSAGDMESESRSKPNPTLTHDTFMSFCGKDTESFASSLYTALTEDEVFYRDNDKLVSGDQIMPSVLRAIEASIISIVIFSRNYADSRWRLQELEKIMECHRTEGQVVVPVFYDVDPSDVREQRGMFGEAFEDLMQRILVDEDNMRSWRAALSEASSIVGSFMVYARYESEDIKNVVELVIRLRDMRRTFLFCARDLVGGQSRVQEVIQLLNSQQSKDPLLLGIWGMGGIGKSIIAEVLYHQIRHSFEGTSFLYEVRETWSRLGEVYLQQQLLSDIYKTKIEIDGGESRKMILKERLSRKRILLVLDDVAQLDQMRALCGSREWFGAGSRIIITTRDRHLLSMFGVDHVYRVNELDENESFELFSQMAFKQESPEEDFIELSKEVVAYCKGLPLALRDVGSFLFGRNKKEWKSCMLRLKRIPIKHTHNVLKLSFDILSDEEKKIFLDVACFFVGIDRNDVIHRLNTSARANALVISALQDKALVTIDENDKLGMHPLLRDMGREIIRVESKSKPEKIYDVFLSFRGQDTRASFVSHLYASLANAGIYVFRDDDEIQRGDQISFSLLRSIGSSRICVIVLSRNYANSRWCMTQLENIVEHCETIVPVFYEVDPSEVRNQTGEFGEAFEDLMRKISVDEYRVRKWETTLLEVGGRAGIVVINSRNESEGIHHIVEHVTRLVAKRPVGVEYRVQDAIKLLHGQQSDVPLLGIWGMGCIGKTTIAKAIYNRIEGIFEGRSFLLNIRECWKDDPISLQQTVLNDIYKTATIEIHSIESEKNMLKERLGRKKVLLVLDDVNELGQLDALCGSLKWFRPGSTIIITTRSMHLLRAFGVDHIYKMEEMNENESVELFSWHAFKQASPRNAFYEISRNIVVYSGGLPLALEVLGSYLCDKGITEWESVLENLKRKPNDEIQKKLKISFDDIGHDEKEMFLNIACFFIGMDKQDVIEILNSCGYVAEIGIFTLVEQSLVIVDDKNKLRMHDLLKEMGREIICEESLHEPGKCRRLWLHEEVLDVLSNDKRIDVVEGLALKLPRENTFSLNTRVFEEMNRLRLLQLEGVRLDGDFKYFPRDLRWLCWHGFPLPYIPVEFHQESLVAIELKCSNLKQLSNKGQMLENLKILNLSHSPYLTKTPDFSYLPNLEKLVLKDCPSLSIVSHTIGYLNKLLLLNLKDCTGLHNLPRSIYKLKYLKNLILSGCSLIKKLEEDLEQMESLTTLVADKTAITKVPFSIVRLKSIEYISLCGYKGNSHDVFPSLLRSWMSLTNNPSSMDVFLSFGVEDAGTSFTSHLCASLQNARVTVFRSDFSHPGRDHVSNLTLQAIEKSQISIIIFSKNYANTKWCLKELEKIMECHKTMGQKVLPVFYEVDPSEIRHQRCKFGEAFEKLLNRFSVEEDKVLSWRNALREAADNSGYKVQNSRKESEDVNSVVEHVANLLNKNMFVANYPVGLKSRVEDVFQLLNSQHSNNVLLLGIWGMGGIGKTTIAKGIYKKIGHDFNNKSFLLNVREVWGRNDGQVSLQERLLSDVYKTMKIKIRTVQSGKMILKERLQSKKVLLVLDNVNKLDQLNALCGSREWFGFGSIIIITTRDKHLLKVLGVDHIYKVPELDENESLELFSWHAFKQASPKEDFFNLSKEVVTLSGGLPFALEVHGSILFRREISEWESMLQELKRIPNEEVQEVLKISYDDLHNEEQNIFLDIACFYVGMNQDDVIRQLNSLEQWTKRISSLVDKSLVTVDTNNKLRIHVLLRDMGREIIRELSQIKTKSRVFDVFLNFRGTDTRPSFISHLYTALHIAGIYTFRDDDKIQRGHQISISLLQAIGNSRICLVVLSRNYANSRWCMQELENIMEVRRTMGLVVVPVFYEVNPTDVSNQTGKFGKGFKYLKTKISVDEYKERIWKMALQDLCDIAGKVVVNSGNESADINKIVESVTHLLARTELSVANHPVGVESRVQQATELLISQQPRDVFLLGIWGMGGIGKTTIAKAIYNKIGYNGNFDGRSFLPNIRTVWQQYTNQVSLQQQILNDIYKTTTIKVESIDSGKNILKERLAQKKVLLLLDDVDELNQLNALCGSREWFGPGSKIIITTRDMSLLRGRVNEVYTAKIMNNDESIEHFSWHAFKQASPTTEDFDKCSRSIIAYCGGLPLALEVLGSSLCGREIQEWKTVLNTLKRIPNSEVQEKLKISFNGLNYEQKEIFLDIACFFIGRDLHDVIQILNGCNFSAKFGIGVLVERSLVTVGYKNKLEMHDLLRDMGRDIIREKSPCKPEERSRLWLHEEVLNVLSQTKGTKAVEGLALKLPTEAVEGLALKLRINNTKCLKTKAFKKMKSLRLLQLAGMQLDGDFKYLPSELRWLYWHGFPLDYTPSEFHRGSLVAIELKNSNLKQIWEMGQMEENLKILNLSHSKYLTETPNFSYMPNLEKLILKDCPRLSKVSDTIGCLRKLLQINFKDCKRLHNLPRSIYKLECLEALILSGCSMINKLEEDLEQMKSLTTLMADKTAIRKGPFSIVRSKSVKYISICGFEGFPHDIFPSLIWSWMSPTNNVISLVQTSTCMSSLISLNVPYSSSYSLSSAFNDLPKHPSLRVEGGSELQLTPHVERNIDIKVTNSKELEASAATPQISAMNTSPLLDCRGQVQISGSKTFLKSLLSQMGTKCRALNIPYGSILQTTTFSCQGSSVIFEVPQLNGRNLRGMMLSTVYFSSPDNIASYGCQTLLVINHTKTIIQDYRRDTLTFFENEEWQSIRSNLEPGNKVKVIVVFGHGFIVEKTTVYLLYGEPIDEEMEHCYPEEREIIPSGDYDMAIYGNVSVSGGDDMAADKNFAVSSSKDMPADKNVIISGEDKKVINYGSKPQLQPQSQGFRGLYNRMVTAITVTSVAFVHNCRQCSGFRCLCNKNCDHDHD